MDSAKIIQVIETTSTTGTGTMDDPVRCVKRLWSLDGRCILTIDPWGSEQDDYRHGSAMSNKREAQE